MRYLSLLAIFLFSVACNLNSSDTYYKDSTNWPGFYQGLQKTDRGTILYEITLNSSGEIIFGSFASPGYDNKSYQSDSIAWNESESGFSFKEETYQVQLAQNALKLSWEESVLELQKVEELPPLENINWTLIEIGGKKLKKQGKMPRILLNPSINKLSGYDACNYLNAAYKVYYPKQEIYFSPVAATRRACMDTDSLARAFKGVLASFTKYELNDSLLSLKAEEQVLARFKAD